MHRLFIIILIFIIAVSCEKPDSIDNKATDDADRFYLSSAENGTTDMTEVGNGEKYNIIEENPFIQTNEQSVSTFSIDADGASYSNTRRFITDGQLPLKDAIRTEEMINYFVYDYAEPQYGQNIAIDAELTECPWQKGHNLLRIGIKGKTIKKDELPPANIVLLVDVSGSMSMNGKLDLLKESFELLINNLRAQDKIAIVTYAGKAGIALLSTYGNEKEQILSVLNNLEAGGSTAGAQGITWAYNIATDNYIPEGNNRVILATDGDFNVGPSSQKELVDLIKQKRETGIYLTILGVGKGNLNDALMEQTANNGNGTYEYIDSYEQANKVFNLEYSKFYSVVKDVKVQVEFNELFVEAYRLIGYENRLMENEDFNDVNKDAGEIGAGQTITALYELILKESTDYKTASVTDDKVAFVKFKYKRPQNENNESLFFDVGNNIKSFNEATENTRFAASVVAFSLKARNSIYQGNASCNDIIEWAMKAKSFDPNNYRNGFIEMVNTYKTIKE